MKTVCSYRLQERRNSRVTGKYLHYHEVALRGFSGFGGGRVLVLTDYRNAGLAADGGNWHSVMPSILIDLARVEVVRGAASALYGAGVDSGVIHYICKYAFSYPGATLSVGGGQRSLLSIQGRVAGVLGDKLGQKVLGNYSSGRDFELEPCDEELVMNLMLDQCPDPEDAQQFIIDGGERNTNFCRWVLSGFAEYRFSSSTSLNLTAGLGNITATFPTGGITIRAVNLKGLYAQARFHSN